MAHFSAVSSSARQLFVLLRCINFSSKAQVQISEEGIRFSVEDARVMQGTAFLEKALFTTYNLRIDATAELASNEHNTSEDEDHESELPYFQISLPALLETLQIFGFADAKDRWSTRDPSYSSGINSNSARNGGAGSTFDNRNLGMTGICRLSYDSDSAGDALGITLEEGNVTTTCELVTYEPESFDDIPFDREHLCLKIIMRAPLLYEAITELSSTSAENLTFTASPTAPHFSVSAEGPLGSASVEFSKDPELLETFQVPKKTVNTYKFSFVKAAARAMSIATKVSIRGDTQGVLSLQFMIENDGGGVSFVDFKFVPQLEGDEDGDGLDGADEDYSE